MADISPAEELSVTISDTDNVLDSNSNSTTSTFTYSGVKESDTTAEFRCVADFDGQTHQSQPASVSVLSKSGLINMKWASLVVLSNLFYILYHHFIIMCIGCVKR